MLWNPLEIAAKRLRAVARWRPQVSKLMRRVRHVELSPPHVREEGSRPTRRLAAEQVVDRDIIEDLVSGSEYASPRSTRETLRSLAVEASGDVPVDVDFEEACGYVASPTLEPFRVRNDKTVSGDVIGPRRNTLPINAWSTISPT